MSSSSLSVEKSTAAVPAARSVDPYRNPSYPQRVHVLERATLEEAVRKCDDRLGAAVQKLDVLTNHAQKEKFFRLFYQLQGARDQVAEAARRMPLEVGGLYHEDAERFKQAMDAVERISRQWEQAGG